MMLTRAEKLELVAIAANDFREANDRVNGEPGLEIVETRIEKYRLLCTALDSLDNPAVQSPDDPQEPNPGAQGGQS